MIVSRLCFLVFLALSLLVVADDPTTQDEEVDEVPDDGIPLTCAYLVVGLGTAGTKIAHLLSQDPGVVVVVLEAGVNHDHEAVVRHPPGPPAVQLLQEDERYNLRHKTGLEQSTVNRVLRVHQGKGWAGSMNVNMGFAEHVSRGVLETQWKPAGGPAWGFDNYRAKSVLVENYVGPTDNATLRGHNNVTGIKIVRATPPPFASVFQQAADQVFGGLPPVQDHSSDHEVSTAQLQYNIEGSLFTGGHTRHTVSTALMTNVTVTPDGQPLDPNDRKLYVVSGARVDKLLWKSNSLLPETLVKKIKGARYILNGKRRKILASEKVIVAAGIMTSGILQRSGIGNNLPEGVLQVLNNTNIGNNLATQYGFAVMASFNVSVFSFITPNNFLLSAGLAHFYDETKDTTRRRGTIVTAPGPVFVDQSLSVLFPPPPGFGILSLLTLNLEPTSTGSMHIWTKDPLELPIVNLAPYSTTQDLVSARWMLNKSLQLIQKMNNDTNGTLGIQLLYPPLSLLSSNASIDAWLKANVYQTNHLTGTNRMNNDRTKGVVDGCLHVIGSNPGQRVSNLMVVDNSAFATLPDLGFSIPAVVMGQMGYEFIANPASCTPAA